MNKYHFNDFLIEEPSYLDYKNLLKNLITPDYNVINKVFLNLVEERVNNTNCIDKIKILIFLRGLILGEEININFDGKNYSSSLNEILDKFNFNETPFEYKNLKFSLPSKFYYKDNFTNLIENLKSIKIDGEEKDVTNFNIEEKKILLDNLQDLNFNKLMVNYIEYLKSFYFYYINDVKVNLFTNDIISFLKGIFNSNLQEFYDFEYTIINKLKFDSYSLTIYSFPELRIFVNKFAKEMEEAQQESGKDENTI
jgi:hypothetical protein|tara:strand:+ start:131 stop:889 length:759 start_codon:yes stop_codon:yes gene_type:complete